MKSSKNVESKPLHLADLKTASQMMIIPMVFQDWTRLLRRKLLLGTYVTPGKGCSLIIGILFASHQRIYWDYFRDGPRTVDTNSTDL